MNTSKLSLAICALLVSLAAQACDERKAPPAVYGGSGGTDEDTGVGGEDAGPDSGEAGQDGGPLTGDLCTDHLSGISCQVEEIVNATGTEYCVRFRSGDVKCWDSWGDDPISPDGFVALAAPAARIFGEGNRLAVLLEDNRVQTKWSGELSTWVPDQPVANVSVLGTVQAGIANFVWILFGNASVLTVGAAGEQPLSLPFTPIAISRPSTSRASATVCALTDRGEVRCWGTEGLGLGDMVPRTIEETEPVALGEPAVAVEADDFGACAITASGALRCWNTAGIIGDTANLVRFREQRGVTQISHNPATCWCAVLDNGALTCWSGSGSVLGQGVVVDDATRPLPPIDLGTGRSALQVAVGYDNVCALLDDHSVKCWGKLQRMGALVPIGNEPGEMGDNLPRVDFGTLPRGNLGPEISITSPGRAIDPLFDPILSGENITARCTVEPRQGGGDVDVGSVVMRLHRDTESGVVVAVATPTQLDTTTFEGVFTGAAAAGSAVYWVECSAADTAEPPNAGQSFLPILYDAGPDLAVVSPGGVGQVVGQAQPLRLEVLVAPHLLGVDDPGAAVTSFEVLLAGEVIDVTATNMPGHYAATLDFLGGDFNPPPSGPILISIEATNQRGQTRRIDHEIVVDDTGPAISAVGAYMDGALVRGVQTIRLQVTDALAGTNETSVRGYVANDPSPIVFVRVGSNYEGIVDTQQYGSDATQLPIRLVAADTVGNTSELPLTLRLDNVAPTIALDPPPVREAKRATMGSGLVCSSPFDPVGSDSVSDQQIAQEGAEFRARIEDQNPLEGSGVIATLAGVDPTSVSVYMLNDVTRPILIDTDGDGVCDALNDELDPLSTQYTFDRRDMAPITPAGFSFYPASAATDGEVPTWGTDCAAGMAMTAPTRLCIATSPLTRVIKASLPGPARPAIWGLPMVDTNNCVGRSWDWRANVPNGGPVCVVVEAADNLGNVGVSVPLRVCLQRSSGTGVFDCSADLSWQTRDCMSGTYQQQQVTCTPPLAFSAGYVREDVF